MTHKALVRRLQISCLGLDAVDPLRLLVDDVVAALAQTEQDNIYGYASSLATAIWQKHYMKDSPKWKPLDTTEGVLTQINNMTCGLIKEKSAQPEQEPVAYINVEKRRLEFAEPMVWHTPTVINLERIPLYTHQRTWIGLTGDDWKQITRKANYHWEMTTSEYAERIGELTEAKLKEKNT
jgi:hypothetical protein